MTHKYHTYASKEKGKSNKDAMGLMNLLSMQADHRSRGSSCCFRGAVGRLAGARTEERVPMPTRLLSAALSSAWGETVATHFPRFEGGGHERAAAQEICGGRKVRRQLLEARRVGARAESHITWQPWRKAGRFGDRPKPRGDRRRI